MDQFVNAMQLAPRPFLKAVIAIFAMMGVNVSASPAANATASTPMTTTKNTISFDAISFDDVPGWRDDDHLAAWKAYVASCGAVVKAAESGKPDLSDNAVALADICRQALQISRSGDLRSREDARAFFETHFRPHRVLGAKQDGLLTGYYEPLIKGSRTQTSDFHVPIYRRPSDLVNVVAESERGAKSAGFTHMRKTDSGLEPYLTRAQIEQGGLDGRDLELMYFADPIDVFFMQIQGSGRVELPTGEKVRVAYDGKNGYPYTSIGRVLIDRGEMAAKAMSLEALKTWLRADLQRAKGIMWKNESYVFFRELAGAEARGPIGVNGIPLQAGRSLAVDTAFHVIGTPIYVDAPNLTHATKTGGFHRLMIAQDVGSAIKGPERGDIYFGSGDKAGRLAGTTKEHGHFIVLLPVPAGFDRKTASAKP